MFVVPRNGRTNPKRFEHRSVSLIGQLQPSRVRVRDRDQRKQTLFFFFFNSASRRQTLTVAAAIAAAAGGGAVAFVAAHIHCL